MIDTVQAVLLFVIVLLTILFVILGVQVFYILRDLRQTVKKTNVILDDVEKITEGVAGPVSNLSNLLNNASAFTALGTAAKIFSMFRKKKE